MNAERKLIKKSRSDNYDIDLWQESERQKKKKSNDLVKKTRKEIE